jgi:glycosyltransferase involved in cell wall biosynthesis
MLGSNDTQRYEYTPKLSVVTICKNEKMHVHQWFESVKDADSIFILDTGSEDGTYEELCSISRQHPNMTVVRRAFENVDFSLFRNEALKEANQLFSFDYFINFDMVFHPCQNWKSILVDTIVSEKFPPKIAIKRIEHLTNGVTILERIFRNSPGQWINLVHEHFQLFDNENSVVKCLDLVVDHFSEVTVNKEATYESLIKTMINDYGEINFCYFLISDRFKKREWLEVLKLHNKFTAQIDSEMADEFKTYV